MSTVPPTSKSTTISSPDKTIVPSLLLLATSSGFVNVPISAPEGSRISDYRDRDRRVIREIVIYVGDHGPQSHVRMGAVGNLVDAEFETIDRNLRVAFYLKATAVISEITEIDPQPLSRLNELTANARIIACRC